MFQHRTWPVWKSNIISDCEGSGDQLQYLQANLYIILGLSFLFYDEINICLTEWFYWPNEIILSLKSKTGSTMYILHISVITIILNTLYLVKVQLNEWYDQCSFASPEISPILTGSSNFLLFSLFYFNNKYLQIYVIMTEIKWKVLFFVIFWIF